MPRQDAKPVSSPRPADAPEAPASSLAHYATGPAVDSIPASKRAHGVLEARKSPRPKADPSAAVPTPASVPRAAAQDPLFESAEVMLNNQERPLDKQELANTYKSKTVGGGETQYTGEPISLDLKDADIKDVFRTISELTGLNIVIDPDVHGQATVKLDNVPWDQALELILKQNNLGYIIENNVMRIATTGKLQSEEQQRAALDLARQGSLPTRTVIKRLSYATAGTAAGTLKRVMSPRGDVIVDDRTNTLIIREIQDYMPTVLQLLENLDRPTDQVIIESRIVETTKTFGHTLGVNWGFNGIADAAHGNTTNLIFPNNGAIGGTVFTRPTGNAQPSSTGLALRLGNVLDTFSLDIALNAAENQGLVKIVSSPRVAAMTNQRASIQTGLQIPVQTTVNNTTSVIYVDATLQLQVGAQDRSTLTQYLENVREIERRIQRAEKSHDDETLVLPDRPAGVPFDYEEHIKLMFELMALAYQANVTRVSTFMVAREVSNRTYPQVGVTDGHHAISHHQNRAEKMDKNVKIQTYNIGLFKYYLDRLANTPDGDGSLLDHMVLIYGSNMSNSNAHDHFPLPNLVVGGGTGALKGHRHLKYSDHTPMTNLLVSVLGKVGVHEDTLGDSTGPLSNL